MSNIYMYAHGGSGNHGCEAIVRSTAKILEEAGCKEMHLISANLEEDMQYGVNQICKITEDRQGYSKISWDFFKAYYRLKIKKDFVSMDELIYAKAISKIKCGDVTLSIGGDNYCYADVRKYVMLHNMMLRKGAKTVLWGCSVEPEVVQIPEIAEDLAKYHLIVAREPISYVALKQVNTNVIQVPDPAFTLQTDMLPLPRNWKKGEMVGINVSPLVLQSNMSSEIVYQSYEMLIEYILKNTTYSIALVPHVVWNDNNDLMLLSKLYEEYEKSDRIVLLGDCNCMQLKGYIARCRFFVGARTHATIAAYSSCVPTLVLGYSVKSRGIARDLFGTEENYVLPVQTLRNSDELVEHFKWIVEHEKEIKAHLEDIMPEYISKVYVGKDAVKKLIQ